MKKFVCLVLVSACCLVLSACWEGKVKKSDEVVKENYGPVATPTPDKSGVVVAVSPQPGQTTEKIEEKGFLEHLPPSFQQPNDEVSKKLLREYGAVYVAKNGVKVPDQVVFRDAGDVDAFQSKVDRASETVGGVLIELQKPAMEDLRAAIADGANKGVKITPKGKDSARRSYNETVGLWNDRVQRGLKFWSGKGRITAGDAARIRSLSPYDQVPEIFKLEESGIWFSLDNSKTIIYSVAPPGSSQHIAMLALDVTEHDSFYVREVLENHGWFQTVVSDLPHFTYLGVKKSELPNIGLKMMRQGNREFWVPNL